MPDRGNDVEQSPWHFDTLSVRSGISHQVHVTVMMKTPPHFFKLFFNSLSAGVSSLLITFENSLDLDQARQNPDYLTL